MTKELHDYTPEELRAALALAEEREEENIKRQWEALFPKCACGKPATHVAYPVVEYRFRRIFTSHGAAVIGSEWSDSSDAAPGEDECDDSRMWVACEDEECQETAWRVLGPDDQLRWA
jgi:hypothetical protein